MSTTTPGQRPPGISTHSHAPGQQLSDNMLVGNTLIGNSPDATNTASTGNTGISLATAVPTSNASANIVSANSIQNEAVDVAIVNPQPSPCSSTTCWARVWAWLASPPLA